MPLGRFFAHKGRINLPGLLRVVGDVGRLWPIEPKSTSDHRVLPTSREGEREREIDSRFAKAVARPELWTIVLPRATRRAGRKCQTYQRARAQTPPASRRKIMGEEANKGSSVQRVGAQ